MIEIYIGSDVPLKVSQNYHVANHFTIFIDFRKPPIFDFNFLPGNRTPDQSNIVVEGYDPTWVNGVFNEMKGFVLRRPSSLSIVHSQNIYDFLVWIIGIPFSFWLCTQVYVIFDDLLLRYGVVFQSAIYLYTFLVSIITFRVLFHYLRWVCPLVEYKAKGNKILYHRAFLTTISMGWFGQVVYDLLTGRF